jgi:hypothetical protein
MGRTAVIAGTATAVSGHVAAKQQARNAQQGPATAPPEEAPPPAEDVDVIEQIKRFGELRDQGLLTEDEFAAQKAKLLDT